MKIKIKLLYCLSLLFFFSYMANGQTSRDSLNQYVAALQKTPDDSALRVKIILLAQTIKPAPVVSEDADRFMARGKTAIELAKESKEYKNAIAEFNKVTLAAPWLSAGYFNLAVAQELSADYNSAIKNYKFYLLAEPDASDAKDVKTKTYELEYKNEMAVKRQAEANSPQAIEAALLKKVEGAKFVDHFNEAGMVYDRIYEIKERILYITLKIYSLKVEYGQSVDGFKQAGEYPQARISYQEAAFIQTKNLASTETGTLVTTKVTFAFSIRPDGQALIVKRDDRPGTLTIPRQ